MPKMNGVELIQEIRKIDWEIPILPVVALDNLAVLPQIIKLKIADYLFKPLQIITAVKIFNSKIEELNHLEIVEKQQHELTQFKNILVNQTLVSEADLTGKITYANDLFCEISGYSRDELIGQPHNIIRHPDVSPKIYTDLWETIQNGNVWVGKIKNKAKNGSDYFVKATVFPIFDSKGEIFKYMSSRYLITDEEQEKQKLKKYIMSQRTEILKSQQNQKGNVKLEIDAAISKNNIANVHKIEQLNNSKKEIEAELLRLRTAKEHASKKVIKLEKEDREKSEKWEGLQKGYQTKVEKLHATTKTAYEQYEVVKKKNDAYNEKFRQTQENVKLMQGHIEGYRKKISDLEDVIKSLEQDKVELKEEMSSNRGN